MPLRFHTTNSLYEQYIVLNIRTEQIKYPVLLIWSFFTVYRIFIYRYIIVTDHLKVAHPSILFSIVPHRQIRCGVVH